MKRVIALMSGKGGVGKSTLSAHLGRAFAELGEKTLIVELDSGMRGLDLMLNIKDVVFDLDDILNGRCPLRDAIVRSEEQKNLFLLPAPAKFSEFPKADELQILANVFLERFDRVIFDVTAGYVLAKPVASIADEIIVVVSPDPICVRDAGFFNNYLKEEADAINKIHMVVNKVNKSGFKNKLCKNIDTIIDQTGIQLLGVIPYSNEINVKTIKGKRLNSEKNKNRIMEAIARRIRGEDVPLIVTEIK